MLTGELEEIKELEDALANAPSTVRVEKLAEVPMGRWTFPIHGIVMGSQDRTKPTFGIFGGVHGIERIGSRVAISFIRDIISQLKWDEDLNRRLEESRLISIPVVNPGGIALARRGNPRSVDLMRNAPVEADEPVTFLVGGHRISGALPWFRGKKNWGLEIESEALVNFVKREGFEAEALLTLDVHSGFGIKDRIWYPYAKSRTPFPGTPWADEFEGLLESNFPNHIYQFEPQSHNYLTHGDLWDYLFDLHQEVNKNFYLPLTLEMGSWMWVRKNPRQLFSYMGYFNPVLPHRRKRVLRRHQYLIELMWRAVRNHKRWLKLERLKLDRLKLEPLK